MVKLILLLMVRNEAKIIRRCIEAATPHVDALSLVDTGSVHDTISVAKSCKVPHKVVQHDWRNFGHNRSLSYQAVVEYVHELGWDLGISYVMVQDVDMILQAKGLREYLHGTLADAYHMMQFMRGVEYPNARIMRLGLSWRCVGVTHEYWTCDEACVTASCPADVAHLQDLGDGGCKTDKYERD